MNRLPLLLALLLVSFAGQVVTAAVPAATDEAAYQETTLKRAQKIVDALGLADAHQAHAVANRIAQFYRELNALQRARDSQLKAAKANVASDQETRATELKAIASDTDSRRAALHQSFLDDLAAQLTAAQIERVKDGLTYGTLEVTLNAYEKMYPQLTAEQKQQIRAWLVEAREHAMDGFTSEEKHAWFGKYKGRINNYLSKAGYDAKQGEKNLLKSSSAPAAK